MYYGIRDISVDTENAVSDMNGDEYEVVDGIITKGVKLSEITKFFYFKYNKPETGDKRTKYLADNIDIIATTTGKVNGEDGFITGADFGSLVYYNSNNTLGDYHVIFPAQVKYDWGTINVAIDCHVKHTDGNARQR